MTTTTVSANVSERVLKAPHVYRGIDGKCCCGCAGKHRYTAASAAAEGKGRGYAVNGSDINDSYVRKIQKVIVAHLDIAEVQNDFISVVVDGILYIAYDAR